jgi:hypothetical protein
VTVWKKTWNLQPECILGEFILSCYLILIFNRLQHCEYYVFLQTASVDMFLKCMCLNQQPVCLSAFVCACTRELLNKCTSVYKSRKSGLTLIWFFGRGP